MNKNREYFSSRSPLGGIIPLAFLVIFFIALYFIAKGVFTILSWLAIPFLIIALVMDYRVVVDYVKYVFDLMSRKPLHGIGLGVFTVLGYPFVSAFLAFRAVLSKKVKDFTGESNEKKEDYTEYEEVDDNEDFLELEPLEEPEVIKESKQSTDDYEELFD